MQKSNFQWWITVLSTTGQVSHSVWLVPKDRFPDLESDPEVGGKDLLWDPAELWFTANADPEKYWFVDSAVPKSYFGRCALKIKASVAETKKTTQQVEPLAVPGPREDEPNEPASRQPVQATVASGEMNERPAKAGWGGCGGREAFFCVPPFA